MCKESSYVFMLRDGADSLEVQYNEQSEGVYLAEAQIFVAGEHINGGCYFDIDNIEDMDRFISYLKELREKIKKHNEANPDNFHVVKPDVLPQVAIPKSWLPGPVCKKCSKDLTCESFTERQNLLCFDCEKKQILQASLIQGRKDYNEYLTTIHEGKVIQVADSFKPLSEDGLCMALGCYNPRSAMKHYCETHTPYVGVDKQYPAKAIRGKNCSIIGCDNKAKNGFNKCEFHLLPVIKDVD